MKTEACLSPVSLVKEIICLIGDDPYREGLKDTPKRVVQSYAELFSGYQCSESDMEKMLTTFEPESYDEMVMLRGIDFHSTCEHHLLTFFGTAAVAYIPNEKLVGISKLARMVEAFSRRLTNQERIAEQVTTYLDKFLEPLGSACVLKGHHLCMGCRGVKQPNAEMITSKLTGKFKEDATVRKEFFDLVNA